MYYIIPNFSIPAREEVRDPQVVAKSCKKVARFSLFFSTGWRSSERVRGQGEFKI
ncbi:hypothetical protein NIES4075_06090 [Tolypothrix sp. NIES-4075]|nr:hypothetical protein NIES4075_06090 [Tolypothrix sp. NIES-4075]